MKWKRKLLLSISSVVALLVLLELVLRVRDVYTGQIISKDLDALFYKKEAPLHPFFGYTARKNFSGFLPFIEPGRRYWVETNSEGFRTQEFYPKLPDSYRIVLMGDSFLYGYNANQEETIAVVLERLAQKEISEKIEVFSLGIASYSTVRYAALTRAYLDYLKPNLIIVSVDQSDFEDDVVRYDDYEVDSDGAPVVLKQARDMLKRDAKDVELKMGLDRRIQIIESKNSNRKIRLRVGSSLFKTMDDLSTDWTIRRRDKATHDKFAAYRDKQFTIIKYSDLVAKHGTDLSKILPPGFITNNIPYGLEKAKKVYDPTFKCLSYIQRECKRKHVSLYLASYPYPWMVSIEECIIPTIVNLGVIYDFRDNRVHPMLLDEYARQLGVPHLNAYPVFEKDARKKYGDIDAHFNAYGYELYSRFLFNSIKPEIIKQLSQK
jgi:hypothetical protein